MNARTAKLTRRYIEAVVPSDRPAMRRLSLKNLRRLWNRKSHLERNRYRLFLQGKISAIQQAGLVVKKA